MTFPFPESYSNLSQVCMFIASICLVECVTTLIVVNGFLPNGVKDKLYLCSCILTLPKITIMLYYAVQAVHESFHGDALEQIYHERDGIPLDYQQLGMFFCLYISHSLCATVTELWKDGFGKGTFTMLLHHGISIGAYTVAMYTGRFGYCCVLASLCEMTNYPLCLLYITKTKGGGVKEWMESTFGVLLSINGAVLWLAFVVFRLMLFPYVNYTFVTSCLSLKKNYPDRWKEVWWTELIGHFSVVTLLFGMSCFWFYKIHVGIMKILKGMKASDAAPEKME